LALPVQPVENRLELTRFGANKNRHFRSRPSSLGAYLEIQRLGANTHAQFYPRLIWAFNASQLRSI
jgi:hypothetical protein